MKTFYPCIFLLCLISCAPYIPQESFAPRPNSLMDIPLRPHDHTVDILLNNEWPKEPYYRVKMVEVRSNADASLDDMINNMKQQARTEGVDAVILENTGAQSNEAPSFDANGFVYHKLTGIGLRYKRTINYMDSLMKIQTVKQWIPGDNTAKEFDLKFDLRGSFQPANASAAQVFNEEIYPYDAFDIHYPSQPGWEFQPDEEGRLSGKRLPAIEISRVACKFIYSDNGILKEIRIRKLAKDGMNIEKQSLKIFYDEQGRVSRKELFEKDERVWVEVPVYYMSGKLMKTERFGFENGKKVILQESSFTYYSNEDLPPATMP